MNAESPDRPAVDALQVARQASYIPLPELVGRIYDTAPTPERCRILEYLLQPLGALALVGVCGGVFTKIWFRSGLHDLHIRPEDADAVSSVDVTRLADYVQHASSDTLAGLAAQLSRSPHLVYSASAAMLVTLLVQRIRARRARDVDNGVAPGP